MSSNTQYIQLPFLYANGGVVSIASNTTLAVTSGQFRDSSNVMDIVLPAVTVNAAVNGINGLDTGSLANSTSYAVYAVGDSTLTNTSGVIISTNLANAPYLPSGYDVVRRIGFVRTDGSAHFLAQLMSGTGTDRTISWDSMIGVLTSSGTSTSLAAIDLSSAVPAVDNLRVQINASITPGSSGGGSTVGFTTGAGTATTIQKISGPVASVIQWGNLEVTATLVSGVPKIQYIVTNVAGTGTATVYVSGYRYSI